MYQPKDVKQQKKSHWEMCPECLEEFRTQTATICEVCKRKIARLKAYHAKKEKNEKTK